MSERVLFAAEVNRIQDTLFRASLQRQVVGGSQLLKVFGEQIKAEAAKQGGKALVWRGGNFRIEFDSKAKAEEFGRFLSNAYQELLDGMITVVEPVSLTNGFEKANNELSQRLNKHKRAQTSAVSPVHSPTTAFCQSSGSGLASRYTPIVFGEEADETSKEPRYLSKTAETKMDVGYRSKRGDRNNDFLQGVAQHLPAGYQDRAWISKPEQLAGEDYERSNVAYLVADGNNMGKLFSKCQTSDQLTALSNTLTEAVQKAVAAPLPALCQAIGKPDILPLLPLIMAGDDIFVLLSAPYAVHYAQEFCLAFEKEMRANKTVEQLCAATRHPFPTMSAAIVFCKANYPYHLAHKRGEDLLAETKRMVKRVGHHGGEWFSALSLTLIMGSELLQADTNGETDYRGHLTTYWATDQLNPTAQAASHPVSNLYAHRGSLDPVFFPRKRLVELCQLYAPNHLPHDVASQTMWAKELDDLRDRINATDISGQQWLRLEQMLQKLGSKKTVGYWKDIKRGLTEFKGHGFLDLHTAWNYLEKMQEVA